MEEANNNSCFPPIVTQVMKRQCSICSKNITHLDSNAGCVVVDATCGFQCHLDCENLIDQNSTTNYSSDISLEGNKCNDKAERLEFNDQA